MGEEPGLVMLVHTVEPSTPTTEAMRLLHSWAATESVAAPAEAESDRLGARRS